MVRRGVVCWALAFSVIAAAAGGCGGNPENQAPAAISEETQKKTGEMLKNYGNQYNEMYKAKRAAQH
jgi:hypothetical protein